MSNWAPMNLQIDADLAIVLLIHCKDLRKFYGRNLVVQHRRSKTAFYYQSDKQCLFTINSLAFRIQVRSYEVLDPTADVGGLILGFSAPRVVVGAGNCRPRTDEVSASC